MRISDSPSHGAQPRGDATPLKSFRSNAIPETPRATNDRSRGTVTKQEIARAVYSNCLRLSRLEAKTLVDAVLEEIISAVAQEGKVALRDFGAFSVLHKRQRMGRNPKTGAVAPITARRVVVFRTSYKLKAKVAPVDR